MATVATNISTMPWDTHAAARSTAAHTLYLPVSRPRARNPRPNIAQREGDREGELAGHRRLEVAAVDAEALVEGERQPGEGEQLGQRVAEPGHPTERPARDREQHQPADRHQLEGDPVRQDGVDGDDRQRREHHVEAVGGHPAVPVHRPPVELPVGQQHVTQVGGTPHVGAHVAAGRRVVDEDQVVAREEVDDLHHDDRAHGEGDRRGAELDDALGRPGTSRPRHRPGDDPATGALQPVAVAPGNRLARPDGRRRIAGVLVEGLVDGLDCRSPATGRR